MGKKKTDIVYLCIHKRLLENSLKTGKIITKESAEYIIGVLYHIPKPLKRAVLKELELMGLVKINDKKEIEVIDNKTDLDNTSKIYREVGLF